MATNFSLWAKTGNISLPGTGPVPFWGFAGSAAGPAQLPGPHMEVPQNDNVQVILTNDLGFPVSVMFPGQEFTPQPARDSGGLFVSYNSETAPGGAFSYNLTPGRPGIFLYESGTSPEKQVQMGLYGVMVVRPAGFDPGNPATWTAYGPGTGTEYDVEKILVTGEIDTNLHQELAAGSPAAEFNPGHFIINGRSYPDTTDPDSGGGQPYGSRVSVTSGQRVLLRIINAGFINHNIRFLGITPRVMAGDSWPLLSAGLDKSYEKNTITIGSGQSYDLLFTAPAAGQYMLYDRNLNCSVNDNTFPGGMMTVIEVV